MPKAAIEHQSAGPFGQFVLDTFRHAGNGDEVKARRALGTARSGTRSSRRGGERGEGGAEAAILAPRMPPGVPPRVAFPRRSLAPRPHRGCRARVTAPHPINAGPG